MLLFITPEYELPTKYVSAWARTLFGVAKEKGYTVKDLKKTHATRTVLESQLKKVSPKFLMFNGHGNSETVFGHKDEPLVKVNDNEEILKSTIIYAVACDSALESAPAAVRAGAIAYIGYKRPFIFSANKTSSEDPLDDKRAEPFFVSSNQIVISLLKNRTVQKSVEKSKSSFAGSINRLISSEATEDDLLDARFLSWNMRHQVYVGNGDATL